MRPVDARPRDTSPFGARQMLGNVREWVADRYGPHDVADVDNPHGPPAGSPNAERVVRGASAVSAAQAHRTTARGRLGPRQCMPDVGFRVAFTLNP